MGRALVLTFLARGIAAFGSLALALVIGRIYGPEGMGVYALAQSVLLGIAVMARYGMSNSLMRYVGQNPDGAQIPVFLKWALSRAAITSVLVALLVGLLRAPLESAFSAEGLAGVVIGIALAAPAFTLCFLLSGFFKGVRKPVTAVLLENGSVALIAGALIALWAGLYGAKDLAVIGYAYAIAAWMVFAQAAHQTWRWCHQNGSRIESESDACTTVSRAAFMSTSRAFFFSNLAGFMQSVLGIMAAGLVLTSAELGLFKSSQQVSVLISFVLIVINAVFPPRFASLYHQGQIQALGRLARQGAVLGAAVAAPLLLLCLAVPGWVLGWFGEGFGDGASLLRIIAAAQLVNVVTGSVGFLLNMTGHERLMRNIALICNGVGLVGFFALPYFFGAMGAALAMAFVLVTQNLAAMFFVWRRLGIWTLPGPNLILWLGIRGAASDE